MPKSGDMRVDAAWDAMLAYNAAMIAAWRWAEGGATKADFDKAHTKASAAERAFYEVLREEEKRAGRANPHA